MEQEVLVQQSMKRHVKVLLPIWSKEYIDAFLLFGLPSLLAPGNLPALAVACDVEFVFLTQEAAHSYISSSDAVQRLMMLCSVRFINIDDLILSKSHNLYGYTLSFAFMRGIQASGKQMVDSHFVFLVSDFVYANGSLQSLARHINEGRTVILSAALRVRRYEAAKELCNINFNHDMNVVVPPRQLINIALRHLHPSLLAKVVNYPFVYSGNFQHLFWRVNKHTMIGRNFLAHPLCLKPERFIKDIHGFCDYAFIPELCPNVDITRDIGYLSDSDDFAAIELQSDEHELSFCRLGQRSMQQIVEYLSKWTTREHRFFATHSFVFHGHELPSNIGKHEANADKFIARILHNLSSIEPAPAIGNLHWVMGVAHFKNLCNMAVLKPATTASLGPRSSLEVFLSSLRPVNTARRLSIGGFYGSELSYIADLTLANLTPSKHQLMLDPFLILLLWTGCRIKSTRYRIKNMFDQAFAISFHHYDKFRSVLLKQR